LKKVEENILPKNKSGRELLCILSLWEEINNNNNNNNKSLGIGYALFRERQVKSVEYACDLC